MSEKVTIKIDAADNCFEYHELKREMETENRRQILRMCKEAKVDIYQFTFKSDIDTYHKVCGTEWYCMREYKLYRQLGFGIIDDIELIEP